MPTPPTLPTDAPLPVYGEPPIVGVPGTFSTAWYKWFTVLNTLVKQLKTNFPGVITSQNVNFDEEITGQFDFPLAGTETLVLDAKYARSVLEVTVQTQAGTATLTPKINGTTLGGGASSASTTKSTVSHSSANSMNAGDKLDLVLSSVSSDCAGLAFTLKTRRQIAMLQYA
jgi:hypothetical protein